MAARTESGLALRSTSSTTPGAALAELDSLYGHACHQFDVWQGRRVRPRDAADHVNSSKSSPMVASPQPTS